MRKTKAPTWFVEWSTEFKKENDARWERQENFNDEQRRFNNQVLSRLDIIEDKLERNNIK